MGCDDTVSHQQKFHLIIKTFILLFNFDYCFYWWSYSIIHFIYQSVSQFVIYTSFSSWLLFLLVKLLYISLNLSVSQSVSQFVIYTSFSIWLLFLLVKLLYISLYLSVSKSVRLSSYQSVHNATREKGFSKHLIFKGFLVYFSFCKLSLLLFFDMPKATEMTRKHWFFLFGWKSEH